MSSLPSFVIEIGIFIKGLGDITHDSRDGTTEQSLLLLCHCSCTKPTVSKYDKFCLEECCPEITLMSQITVYTQRLCLCCKIKQDQGENLNTGCPFVHIVECLFCFLVLFLVVLELALCQTKSLDIVWKIDHPKDHSNRSFKLAMWTKMQWMSNVVLQCYLRRLCSLKNFHRLKCQSTVCATHTLSFT